MAKSHYMVRDRWSTRATEGVLFAMAWALRQITRPLPVWWLARIIAPAGAALMMALPGVRNRAIGNLSKVWPDLSQSEHSRIARAAARQFMYLCAEYAHLDKFLGSIECRTEGLAHLHAAKAAGKGAVIVSAHYGNWEAVRLAALEAGCETGIIYRAFNNRYLDRFTMNLIPRAGAPVLQKGRQGMRQLVGHVARGGFVMILVDQRNSGAPYLDFLGHPAETVTAAADLAHRTGAALIPARAVRTDHGRSFGVTFEAPITGDAPEPMMQAVNDRIGAWIREHPDQWFWFHRRWRTTLRSRGAPGGPVVHD